MPGDAAPRRPSLIGVYDTVISLRREVSLFLGGAWAGGLPVWWRRRNGR